MKNFRKFLLENVGNFILSDNLKKILGQMKSPIAKDILATKNLRSPIFLDTYDDSNFSFSSTIDGTKQVIRIGRFINRNFINIIQNYSDRDIEFFVTEYKNIFLGFSFSQNLGELEYSEEETLMFLDLCEDYINEIEPQMIRSIIHYFCTEFKDNNIVFYRGDRKIMGDGFLLNSHLTKTQLENKFNYISTEFVSSDLWKEKGYPLKKNSVNISKEHSVAYQFSSGTIYNIIPLDGAKLVCLPKLFGNYTPEIFYKEGFNENIANFAMDLQDDSGMFVNIDNVNEVINKLSNLYDNGRIKNDIYKRMKHHNMSFIDYMEYLFSPEHFTVKDYKDFDKNIMDKYVNFYTNQRVLMISNVNILKEHMTEEGRWGNVGAGILPFSRKTKRFLIPFRSPYVLEPNTWGVWGGKLDDEDKNNIKRAALREFKEETKYTGNVLTIPSYIFRDKNFTYYNFIGIIEDEFKPSLDWETNNYKWVTFDELLKLNPKHFGLEYLLDNSEKQLRKLIK